jgi:membrane-bound serine protease (ClpP class)
MFYQYLTLSIYLIIRYDYNDNMKIKIITLLFIVFIGFFSQNASAGGAIHVVKVDGIVNPVMAEFIVKNIDEAEKQGATLFVIELDTPGGLDTSMRTIVKKITSSDTPIAVYVAPSGSRAASAGVFILLSAHIAAMSPGANIGAAHPVALGNDMDKTMAKKAENDAAAYIKSIAEQRGRNAQWAEKAVRESVSATESEALELKVIDYVEKDLESLLKRLDGKEVETATGKKTIQTKGAQVNLVEMGLRHKILDLISNPNVAYMLMLLGFYGIFFELTSPGSIFPGVFGSICLILAFYSFQTLPVNYAGLLLIVLAIILFILEVKIISHGFLTIGGLISMTLGSLMLFDSPLPFFRVSLAVILPTVSVTALFIIAALTLAIQAQRRKPLTGVEGLTGFEGVALEDIDRFKGSVFVRGEIWKARSDSPIDKKSAVIVESVDGLQLNVKQKEC